MNKLIYIFGIIIFLLTNSAITQEFVSTNPQLRNVVLEEYTGIHCGNCPGGHKKAKELAETNPGRVVLISIHEGSYAIPGTGEPDFRTQWGSAILNQTRLSGFPAGTINRLRFPGKDYSFPYNTQMTGGMALGPNGWDAAAKDSVLNGEYSPVNIAAKTRWNNDTRELEIKVELYFTSDIPDGAKLNIALLESHVWGPQTGASDPKNYEHNHILRDLITGQWGESISATQKGSTFSKIYTYTVSDKLNVLNCDIALFVTKTNNEEIFTGIEQQVIPPNLSIAIGNVDGEVNNMNSKSSKDIRFEITNISEKDLFIEITMDQSDRTPDDWIARFVNAQDLFFVLPVASRITIPIMLMTGATKGIGDFIFKFAESDSISTPIIDTVTVLTTDIGLLEIDAGGTNISSLQSVRNDFVSFPLLTYKQISDRLKDLNIVVWNSGPKGRLTANDANIVDSLFNSGIGIVMNGSGALPTLTLDDPSNKLFSTFGINWSEQNQIELETFGLKGIEGDPITNGFNAQSLSVANNGYLMQSVNITNPEFAYPILKMTENDKTLSVRIDKENSRAVYLGFNLNILTDTEQKELLMKNSLDWIEGIVGVDENDINKNPFGLTVYRNLIDDIVIIQIDGDYSKGLHTDIYIIDLLGRRVKNLFSGQVNSDEISFSTDDILPGIFLLVINTDGKLFSKSLIK